jgi:CxxC motif-containing protein (DUF1111 family)
MARGQVASPTEDRNPHYYAFDLLRLEGRDLMREPLRVINGGALKVSDSLGYKVIHPYSDFLLHDIGTGDGIPVQPTSEFAGTANQIRTAPLWGLRTRSRLMHDGLTFTRQEAIKRHGGQAAGVAQAFNALTAQQQAAVMAFLNSL